MLESSAPARSILDSPTLWFDATREPIASLMTCTRWPASMAPSTVWGDADVGLDARHEQLLPTQLGEPPLEVLVTEAAERELVERLDVGRRLQNGRHRGPEPLGILRRQHDRHVENRCQTQQQERVVQQPLLAIDCGEQLFLEVDDHQGCLVRVQASGLQDTSHGRVPAHSATTPWSASRWLSKK